MYGYTNWMHDEHGWVVQTRSMHRRVYMESSRSQVTGTASRGSGRVTDVRLHSPKLKFWYHFYVYTSAF